jgi:hypothetical protein
MSTMYLVVRRAVQSDGSGCGDQGDPDTGSRVPLRMFADRAAAERLVAALTADAQRTMNPFHLNDYGVPEPVRKKLKQLRLSAACPKEAWSEEWRAWWDRCVDELTDEQRAAVWALLGASPCEVVEVDAE